jgi:hypothetical protein
MIALVVRKAGKPDHGHDILKNPGCRHAWLYDGGGVLDAGQEGPILIAHGLIWFSAARDASNISPIVFVAATDVEANDVAGPKLSFGRLDIHQR